jgi:putative aldouronate transport system permease protein
MMELGSSPSRKLFVLFNYILCTLTAILCLFPLLHILALSFSSSASVNAGRVVLIPIGMSLNAYRYVMKNAQFFTSLAISCERCVLGLAVNLLMVVLAGYPLSKTRSRFAGRQFYVWYFVVTMLFSAGLIPTYLVVSQTGLINTIWALILPGAVPVFNVILMQNFIRALPDEISESAFVDGAGHWLTLWKIVLPLCKPSLAAITLFILVDHWNEWFNGIIYMNDPKLYPLQSYLRAQIVDMTKIDLSMTPEDLIARASESSNRAAQMFLAMIPVLIVYPFLQKYFTTGIVMGSVKG